MNEEKAFDCIKIALLAIATIGLITVYLLAAHNKDFQTTGTLITASEQLAKDIPEDSILLGYSTEFLCMETRIKCIPLYYNYNNERPFERFKPTHLLLQKGHDDKILNEAYPQGWRNRIEYLKEYQVGNSKIELYKVKEVKQI